VPGEPPWLWLGRTETIRLAGIDSRPRQVFGSQTAIHVCLIFRQDMTVSILGRIVTDWLGGHPSRWEAAELRTGEGWSGMAGSAVLNDGHWHNSGQKPGGSAGVMGGSQSHSPWEIRKYRRARLQEALINVVCPAEVTRVSTVYPYP
jgi:hypothetical protein